jgi:hypothetical protein
METIIAAIRDFGLPTVAAAVIIFVVLRGELQFRYPARRR